MRCTSTSTYLLCTESNWSEASLVVLFVQSVWFLVEMNVCVSLGVKKTSCNLNESPLCKTLTSGATCKAIVPFLDLYPKATVRVTFYLRPRNGYRSMQHATRMVTRLSLDMQSVNTSGCKAPLLTVDAINNLFFYQHVFLVLQVGRRRKSYLEQSWFLLRTCASTCNQR